MRSISQVAKLTGVSIRTLQYYDEIDLLKPTKLTTSGYRMYDDNALQTLQQILFFRELGFSLKEIKEIIEKPDFNKIDAYKNQKKMFLLKRRRIDRLISLLDRLEKGENCMSFKEFTLSDYIEALEEFKITQSKSIIQYWGSIENFEMFIQKIKDDEDHVTRLAIQQYGSIEKYTEEMRYNLEHFSEFMEQWYSQIPKEKLKEDKFSLLCSCKDKNVASDQVQTIIEEILCDAQESASKLLINNTESYCRMIIETYSDDYLSRVFDAKHGSGSSAYIVKAFRHYCENNNLKIN